MFKEVSLYYDKYNMLLETFNEITKNKYRNQNNLSENYDACIFIPYGPKCYIWFTIVDNYPVCVLIDINKNSGTPTIVTKRICFNNELSIEKGTIFFCVKQNYKSIIIEDILMYKGKYINKTFKEKLKIYKHFFSKEYKNDKYNELTISLAWIRNNITDEDVNLKIPYDVYSIKYVALNSNNYRIILSKNDIEHDKIKYTFAIKNKNECELYELYILNKENKQIIYDYALINDLYTSKMIKNAFRNRENEELIFKCIYNKKYKGWIPYNLVKDKHIRISNVNELRKYPSNNF